MSATTAGYRRMRRRWGREPSAIRPYGKAAFVGRAGLLYLVSRRFVQTLVAIAALTFLAWWVMRLTPTGPIDGIDLVMVAGRNETLLLHLAAALLASIIGIAVHTPFGETERVSPVVLPVMRGVHLVAMFAIGCLALSLVIWGWTDVMPGVDLVPLFVRNAFFLTGVVLLVGRFIDVRLAWMLPVMLGGVTNVSLLRKLDGIEFPELLWRDNGRNILALDLSHTHATAICLGIGLAAFAIYIRDGVRDTAEGE